MALTVQQSYLLGTTPPAKPTVAPAILRKAVMTQQPQFGAEIDWGNPLTRGMSLCAGKDFSVNIAKSTKLTKTITTGDASLRFTKAGIGASTDGIATSFNQSADVIGNGDVTVMMYGAPAASGTYKGQALGQIGSNGNVWFSANANEQDSVVSGQLCLGLLQTGVNRSAVKVAGAVDGSLSVYVVGKTSGAGYAWKNGNPLTVTTYGSLAGAPTLSSDSITVCGSSGTSTASTTGPLLLVVAWKRLLTSSEVKSISDNPWQIFRAPQPRAWVGI